MPAKNPRLTITIEPALHAQLRRLSELTGNSQSALIADILEGSGPVFDKVIRALEAAKTATASMRGKASVELDAAQARVEKQLGLVTDELDRATLPLFQEDEGVKRRARKQSSGAQDVGGTTPVRSAAQRRQATGGTPPSNRGVRSTANPSKKAKQKGLNHGQV